MWKACWGIYLIWLAVVSNSMIQLAVTGDPSSLAWLCQEATRFFHGNFKPQMTLCCKAAVWLGNILRNKNENIQHPWFLSVPGGALTKINTRDKVFPWMLSAWIIPHVIFFSVSLLWSFSFSPLQPATFSHILIIILNHVVCYPHPPTIAQRSFLIQPHLRKLRTWIFCDRVYLPQWLDCKIVLWSIYLKIN